MECPSRCRSRAIVATHLPTASRTDRPGSGWMSSGSAGEVVGLRVPRFVRSLLGSPQAANDAPLSRSLAKVPRWYCRFRRARRTSIPWLRPTRDRTASWDEHLDRERFADMTVAVADFEGHGWVVRERLWYGFPDPPGYVLFAIDGEAVRLAWDIQRWPAVWCEPQKARGRSDEA